MPAPRRSSQTELFEVQAIEPPPLRPPLRDLVLQQMVQWMQAVAAAVNEVNEEAGREQQDHR